MADRSRISTSPLIFDCYIRRSNTFLQRDSEGEPATPNWQRLGLTEQEADEWNRRRDYWVNILIKKYTDRSKRTQVVTEEVKNFIASFREFANPLLNIIAVNRAATAEDAAVFNFKLRRKKPSVVREQITELCFASLQPVGGGRMFMKCRTATQSKRGSLPARTDSVMFAYRIGDTVPQHPDDGCTIITRRQSKIDFDFGVKASGKRVHIFFCWNDSKRPWLSGPWSNVRSSVIV